MRSVIKKSNYLIQSNFNLNLNEQRLILLRISQIRKEDLILDNQNYIINLNLIDRKFVKMNRQRIKNFCKNILKKPFLIKKEKGNFITRNWFRDIEYLSDTNELEVSFSKKIKPFLFELKENFSSYNIKEIMSFKSRYSIRIFEMLIQYKNTNHKSLKINLNDFYKRLNISDSMSKISKLKDRILEVRKKEINENSNITMNYKLIKKGRSFTDIEFKFSNNYKVLNQRKESKSSDYLEKQLNEVLCLSNDDYTDYTFQYETDIKNKKVINSNETIKIPKRNLYSEEEQNYIIENYINHFYSNRQFIFENIIYELNNFRFNKQTNSYIVNENLVSEKYELNTKIEDSESFYYFLKSSLTTDEEIKKNSYLPF